MLQQHGIRSTMTEKEDPLENAVAERLNGIIKQEYLNLDEVDTMHEAIIALERAVRLYNGERPHASISMLTPDQVHYGQMPGRWTWKN